MHDIMQYNPIQGQGQGHEPFKVGNQANSNSYRMGAGNWPRILKLRHNI